MCVDGFSKKNSFFPLHKFLFCQQNDFTQKDTEVISAFKYFKLAICITRCRNKRRNCKMVLVELGEMFSFSAQSFYFLLCFGCVKCRKTGREG